MDEKKFEIRRKKWNVVAAIPKERLGFATKDAKGVDSISTSNWTRMGSEKQSVYVEHVHLCPAQPKLDGTLFCDMMNKPESTLINFNTKQENLEIKTYKRPNSWKIDGNTLYKTACGLCEFKYPRENLTVMIYFQSKGIVSLKSIYRKREEWGMKIPPTKNKWNVSYMYNMVKICRFCTQLFQPSTKNVIYPDPPCIFNLKKKKPIRVVIEEELFKENPGLKEMLENNGDSFDKQLNVLLDQRRKDLKFNSSRRSRKIKSASPVRSKNKFFNTGMEENSIYISNQLTNEVCDKIESNNPKPWWIKNRPKSARTYYEIQNNQESLYELNLYKSGKMPQVGYQITIPTGNNMCTPRARDTLRANIRSISREGDRTNRRSLFSKKVY